MSSQGVVARDSKEDLIQALASGQLSDAIAKQGQDILARMEKPLRLSVLGLPGSGKSTLMNLLLGESVFRRDFALPTVSMTYGEEVLAKCTLANGEVKTLDSVALDAIAALKPAFVELEMPIAALRKLSMMEVVAGDDLTQQRRAISWAAKRTDIGLWCTQECTEQEEQLWSLLPDRVQDHSFLVLSKADELGAQGRLADLVKQANEVGGDYFRQTLPVATSVALSARKPDGSVDKSTLRSSGGIALISAILREVETGQRAAADTADIFLRQIDFDPVAAAQETEAQAVADPRTETPVAAEAETPAAPEALTPETAAPSAQAAEPKAETAATKAEIQVAPLKEAPKSEAQETAHSDAGMTSEARALCAQVVEQLAAEGEALAHQLEAGELDPATAIDVSVDTVIWLADYLSDNPAAGEPSMTRTCAAAHDAADLVQLIKLEKGDSVVLDALSVMIQLKHEIQAELAA